MEQLEREKHKQMIMIIHRKVKKGRKEVTHKERRSEKERERERKERKERKERERERKREKDERTKE